MKSLKEKEQQNLREPCDGSTDEKPVLRPAYEFKEELCGLLRLCGQTKALCRAHIRKLKGLMEQMEDDSNEHFKAWNKTMRRWYKPIIRMGRYHLNHGITEDLHRKVKLLQRRAYVFRNFGNERLRVPVECSRGGDGDSKRDSTNVALDPKSVSWSVAAGGLKDAGTSLSFFRCC